LWTYFTKAPTWPSWDDRKQLRWLAQTKVITLKTQLHAVNACVKRLSQRSFNHSLNIRERLLAKELTWYLWSILARVALNSYVHCSLLKNADLTESDHFLPIDLIDNFVWHLLSFAVQVEQFFNIVTSLRVTWEYIWILT